METKVNIGITHTHLSEWVIAGLYFHSARQRRSGHTQILFFIFYFKLFPIFGIHLSLFID
jgi:hypothetical protein